jgi:hypothetical protein
MHTASLVRIPLKVTESFNFVTIGHCFPSNPTCTHLPQTLGNPICSKMYFVFFHLSDIDTAKCSNFFCCMLVSAVFIKYSAGYYSSECSAYSIVGRSLENISKFGTHIHWHAHTQNYTWVFIVLCTFITFYYFPASTSMICSAGPTSIIFWKYSVLRGQAFGRKKVSLVPS